MLDIIISAIPIIVAVVLVILLIMTAWVKTPADKAKVITGFKKRVLIGKGGFKVPFFEHVCEISLEDIPLSTDVAESPSMGGLLVDVKANAVVKVNSTDPAQVIKAVEQFCQGNVSNTTEGIQQNVEVVLEGQLRGVVAKLTVDQIVSDLQKFSDSIEEGANKDLAKMGLELISYTVLKVTTPQSNYLENKAKHQEVQSKSDADIVTAERQRDTNIKTAEANRAGQAAKLESETKIAESEKDKNLKLALYRAEQDRAKATADQAYTIAEMTKKTELEDANAELARRQAIAKKEQLVAEVEVPAEAQKRRAEIEAEAKKQVAIFEAQAEAEKIRLKAEAEAQAMKVRAEAEAEAIKLRGAADADAIMAKGLAEAEAIHKKGEAFQAYGEAGCLSLVMDGAPKIFSEISKPMEKINDIHVYGTGDGKAASSVVGTVTNVAGMGFNAIKDMTGVNIASLLNNITAKQANKIVSPTVAPVVSPDTVDVIEGTGEVLPPDTDCRVSETSKTPVKSTDTRMSSTDTQNHKK